MLQADKNHRLKSCWCHLTPHKTDYVSIKFSEIKHFQLLSQSSGGSCVILFTVRKMWYMQDIRKKSLLKQKQKTLPPVYVMEGY